MLTFTPKMKPEVVLAARCSFGVNLTSPIDSPTSVCFLSYIWHFLSISNLWHVIRNFDTFKIGPQVVLAARWRPKAKWRHRSILRPRICVGCPLKFFVYLLPFKSYSSVLIWLEIWHPGSKIWGFRVFWPLNVISYQRGPQKSLPYSKPRRLNYRACKSVEPFRL